MHKQLEDRYAAADNVVMFHIQTVWEGLSTNTPSNGPKVARSHGIKVPVGYDARLDGARTSLIMSQYGTGGTPWTVVIDKKGVVRYSGFTPENAKPLTKLIDNLRR